MENKNGRQNESDKQEARQRGLEVSKMDNNGWSTEILNWIDSETESDLELEFDRDWNQQLHDKESAFHGIPIREPGTVRILPEPSSGTRDASDERPLRDRDLNLWLELQAMPSASFAIALKTKNIQAMDWKNLIEEIEDLNASQKRALKSYVRRLIEYLLKLKFRHIERKRHGQDWRHEIINMAIRGAIRS